MPQLPAAQEPRRAPLSAAAISASADATPGRLPPGPRTPALVQAAGLLRDPIRMFAGLRSRYGDVFTVRFPSFPPLVYVADPELVKRVFTGDPTAFHAGEANAMVLEPVLGPYSVLTLDEGEHMRQRKILLPPFHGESIRRYADVIREIAERDVRSWPVGRPFPLRPHTQRITLDVILRAVFGIRGRDRFERARRLVDEFGRRSHAIVLFPALRRRFGRLSPYARFERARDELDAFLYEEIARRRKEQSGHDDVLSLLLGATHDDGTPMSERELRDELITVIGAGHETTATALAWALERLLRAPGVLERIRESLAEGDDEYLGLVVKETLRTRPVITDVARKVTRPVEIGRYSIPAGTLVMPAIVAIHHRADLYPEPHEFRPERFLEGQGEGYAWIPFGGGIRRCIGASFAEMEMRIVLRTIFEHVELRAPTPRPERMRPRNITIAPSRGGRIVVDRALARRDTPRELSQT